MLYAWELPDNAAISIFTLLMHLFISRRTIYLKLVIVMTIVLIVITIVLIVMTIVLIVMAIVLMVMSLEGDVMA